MPPTFKKGVFGFNIFFKLYKRKLSSKIKCQDLFLLFIFISFSGQIFMVMIDLRLFMI